MSIVAGAACFAAAAGAGAAAAGAAAASSAGAPDDGAEWAVLRITGDGRCLFRSLAQGDHLAQRAERGLPAALLPAGEEAASADALRHAVCDALEGSREDMEAFIAGDDDDGGHGFDGYVARMRRPGTWGGEPELALAARVPPQRHAVSCRPRVCARSLGLPL